MQKMSEKEAIEMLKAKLTCMKLEALSCIEKGCDKDCDMCEYNYTQGNMGEQKDALATAINAIEEIQQYRAIGTPNQCREAVERMKPKGFIQTEKFNTTMWQCPICYSELYSGQNYCDECGNFIGWDGLE